MNSGSWAVVATIRAPQEMIDKFICHYRNMNASEIHIFLDDPNFINYDKSLLSDSRVNVYICDKELWKTRESKYPLLVSGRPDNVEGRQFSNFLAIQDSSKVDWILNVDVDEFLISNYPISSILRETPDNIFMVGARTLEAVYEDFPKLDDIFSTKLFKNTYKKNADFVAEEFNENLVVNEHGFWGHRLGKGFFRRLEKIKKLSCHYPTPLNSSLLPKFQHKDIELLHFECMTFELFHEKRIRRITGESLTTRISVNNRRRLEYFKKIYEDFGVEGTKDLYSQMNLFSGARLDKAKKSGFLVEKEIIYPPSKKYLHQAISSFHKTKIVVNINTSLVEAVSDDVLKNGEYYPVYIEYELPKNGYAYLYCILNERKIYIHLGEKNELVLYSEHIAYFLKYKKIQDYFALTIDMSDGEDKFLSVKPDGDVKIIANELKSWEKIYLLY